MYVIIGQGRAGTSAANTLRRLAPSAPITVVTDESDYFYSRIDLPDVIAEKHAPASAELQSAEIFGALDITCLMGKTVSAIDPERKEIRLASGESLAFCKLLLASGSVPILPKLIGADASGVYTLWTMADARNIMKSAATARAVVVVGAGLIGLKTALALAARGLKVSVVERLPRIMPRQLDEVGSRLIAERLSCRGIDLFMSTEVTEVVTDGGAVAGVKVPGLVIPADMLVMAIGVKPNAELARKAGIAVGRGIVVDATQQTSIADIYAAGDVAETMDRLTGETVVPATWPVAIEQGRVAAANMTGQTARFDGSMAMNSVDIAGLALVSMGDIEGREGDDVLVRQHGGTYRKLVFRANRLRGALCLGDIRETGVMAGILRRQVETADFARLLSPAFSFRDLMAV